MNILRACADWRVLAILLAVGAGVAVFAPSLIAAAIPFLIVAACPISMLVMMRTMAGQQRYPTARLEPGAVDRRTRLDKQLAAVRLEQQQLERDLTRLESADQISTAAARGGSPTADIRRRST